MQTAWNINIIKSFRGTIRRSGIPSFSALLSSHFSSFTILSCLPVFGTCVFRRQAMDRIKYDLFGIRSLAVLAFFSRCVYAQHFWGMSSELF